MNRLFKSRLLQFTGLIITSLALLASSGNPPNGKTNAPSEGHCKDCHSISNPNGYNGTVEISGITGPIQPLTVYPVTLTMTVSAGSPSRGGFQLVALDASNANCGDLTAPGGSGTGAEFGGSREYIEHRNPRTFSGGTASWTFQWKSPANVSGNQVKFYYIGNFCNGSGSDGDFMVANLETFTFTGGLPVEASISNVNNVLCFGGNTGSATVEAMGGTAPYTYLWSNNQTGATANNLVAGTYTVTVTGASSSGTATAVATVTQPGAALAVTASTIGILTCAQTSVTVAASSTSGTAPYTYNWPNSSTEQSTEVGTAGTYIVTVTDNNGCTKTATTTVTQNIIQPIANAGPNVQLTCNQASATLSGAGSSTGNIYAYLWTTTSGIIASGATTLTPTITAPGIYILTVSNTVNGCTATDAVEVTFNANPPAVSATGGVITCITPSVALSYTADMPVTVLWSGPGNFTSTQSSPIVSVPGTYTVVATNTSGCTSTATAVVSDNTAAPVVTIAAPATLTCALTTLQVCASANIPNATYQWSGPGGFTTTGSCANVTTPGTYTVVVTNTTNGCTKQETVTVAQDIAQPQVTTNNAVLTCSVPSAQICASSTVAGAMFAWPNSTQACITVTSPGTYIVTVTAPNGCTNTAVSTVTTDFNSPIAVIASPGTLNCNFAQLILNASGSSQGNNFTYNWASTNGGNIISGGNTLMPVINNAGTYSTTVTNILSGCTSTASVTVVQSPPLNLNITTQNIACFGTATGAAAATVSGGVAPYLYAWSTSASTASVSNLPAGAYTLIVTDAENCSAMASATITQPTQLQVNTSSTPQSAVGINDGTATALASGGTPAYAYLWSNNQTTAIISGLAPATYTVVVTDANGCTIVQSVTVNSANCNIAGVVTTTNITCNGAANGAATVTVTNATQPVVYQWSGGQSTATVSGLAPGNYTVIATDLGGCSIVASALITEPAVLLANASATAVTGASTNNGTATANPTGGTAPYSYIWSNTFTTQTITDLAPGAYQVLVTDANGCTASQNITVNAFNCNLEISLQVTPISCFSPLSGSISAVVTGGTAPVGYVWSNEATTAIVEGLSAGTYTVTITDGSGCIATASATLVAPEPLSAQVASVINPACPGAATGSAIINVSGGGLAPYTYEWTGFGGASGAPAGTYTVTITAISGCTATVELTLIVVDMVAPVITCPPNIALCDYGFFTAFDFPTATDNCANITITQTAGQISGTYFQPGTTTQSYIATDQAGNTAACSFTVTVFALPDFMATQFTDDLDNTGVGSINVSPFGGTPPYTYAWTKDGDPFATTEDLTGLFEGKYLLMLTDANGCEISLSVITIDNVVDTKEPVLNAQVRVVPNPAQDLIWLKMNDIQPLSVQIVDARGRIVQNLNASDWQQAIDVQQLQAGLYTILIQSDKGMVAVRWIKI